LEALAEGAEDVVQPVELLAHGPFGVAHVPRGRDGFGHAQKL
jgi:hypothetical protein